MELGTDDFGERQLPSVHDGMSIHQKSTRLLGLKSKS
jgi:hypothetical protein